MNVQEINKICELEYLWIHKYLFDKNFENYRPILRKKFVKDNNIKDKFSQEDFYKYDTYIANIKAEWILANINKVFTEDEKRIIYSHAE